MSLPNKGEVLSASKNSKTSATAGNSDHFNVGISNTTTEHNVHFKDEQLSYMTAIDANPDNTFASQDQNDVNLGDFMSRPIKIFEATIDVGSSSLIDVVIDPWRVFFENKRNINRVANFYLMRSNLRIKAVINGNPFYYGRFLLSYVPFYDSDQLIVKNRIAWTEEDLVAATQRPHVFLDPTLSQGAEMLLPFFSDTSNVSVPASEWTKLGSLQLKAVSELRHANGGTEPISLTIFAWAEDVSLNIPTSENPSTLTPQAGEMTGEYRDDEIDQATGIVSKPMSILGNVASALAVLPAIRPYAMAVQLGASTVGTIAKMFGYSRPKLAAVPSTRYQPEIFGNIAGLDVGENVTSLTLDSKQELSIDPRTTGLDQTDEMTISSIASKWSYLYKFPFEATAVKDQCIAQMRVDPTLLRENGQEKHLTSVAFASLPFKYWTGTLRYRFQVICSSYHKGRLRIVYDPVATSISNDEYNVNYMHVVDISETRDFVLDVGPCQNVPLMEKQTVSLYSEVGTFNQGGSSLNSQTYGNGIIGVYVINELTSPAIPATDIEIAVYVSAGKDFRLYVPIDTDLRNISLASPFGGGLVEQSGEMSGPIVESASPEGTTDSRLVNDSQIDTNLTKVFIGEEFLSYRALLKRYMYHTSYGPNSANAVNYERIAPRMPLNRGFVNGAVHRTALGQPYNYVVPTLLSYISWAYVGMRGSIRWKTIQEEGPDSNPGVISTVRNPLSVYSVSERDMEGEGGTDSNIARASVADCDTMWPGGIVTHTEQYPVIQAEHPMYSNKRFIPTRIEEWNSATVPDEGRKVRAFVRRNQSTLPLRFQEYVAAGDDFSLFFYVGPPIIYIEFGYPAA